MHRCVGICNALNDLSNNNDFSNNVCVPNKTEDLKLSVFNLITLICHANVNVNLMEENEIQINGGIMINVDVTVKYVMYVKIIIFGILLHVVAKMENI